MKKFLLSAFVIMLAIGMKAETVVTFDFDNNATALFGIEGRSSGSGASYDPAGEFNADGVATVDGVTVRVAASDPTENNRNRLWATSPVLRMYNGDLTVSAPGHDITKIVFTGHNTNFNLTPNTGTLEGKTWTSTDAVAEVVFTCSKNTQIKTMTVTLDGTNGDTPNPPTIAGTGEGTAASPYDVERALSLIENEQVATTDVYVAGTISEIIEYSLQYGNATYMIAQGDKSIKVYRGKFFNGEAFTEEDQIKVGDEVVVCGKLVTSYGGQITTGSSIYSLNGVTAPEEPEYVPTGNGSKENPYTVADIQGMKIETADGNKYWVKGVILGSCKSATALNDAESAVDSNIALGASAEASSFIPVALPAGAVRDALGVATNPGNVGKTVLVYGTLEKYFSVPGVKNVTEYELEGTDGINAINCENAPEIYFNLQGVEVVNPEAGNVYIRIQGAKATKVIK